MDTLGTAAKQSDHKCKTISLGGRLIFGAAGVESVGRDGHLILDPTGAARKAYSENSGAHSGENFVEGVARTWDKIIVQGLETLNPADREILMRKTIGRPDWGGDSLVYAVFAGTDNHGDIEVAIVTEGDKARELADGFLDPPLLDWTRNCQPIPRA